MPIQIVGDQIANGAISNAKISDSTILPAKLKLDEIFNFTVLPTVNADPTSGSQLVRKNYVDSKINGLTWKEACTARSSSNIDISNAPANIGGVTGVANPSRILLTGQTTATENGLYKFVGAGNAMSRTSDADSFDKIQDGSAVLIREGDSAGEGYQQQAKLSSFSSQNWILFSATGGGRTADTSKGLDLVGNQFACKVDDSSVGFDGSGNIKVKDSGITNDHLAGSINPSKLTAQNLTVTAGSGLTGGGSANLGGSITVAVQTDSTNTIASGGSGIGVANASITTTQIASQAVETGNVKDKHITLGKIQDVADGKILIGDSNDRLAAVTLSGAITVNNAGATSLGAGVVSNAAIADSTIQNGKLQNNAINFVGGDGIDSLASTQLGGTVTISVDLDSGTLSKGANGLKVSTNGIGTNELGSDVVTSQNLAADCVLAVKIKDGEVGTGKLADDCVTLPKVGFQFKQQFFNGTSATQYDLSESLDSSFIMGTYVFRNGLLCKIVANSPADASEVVVEHNTGTGGVGKLIFGAAPNNDLIIVRYIK